MSRCILCFLTGLTMVAVVATSGSAHERVYRGSRLADNDNANRAIYELTHPWPFRKKGNYSTSRASGASVAPNSIDTGTTRDAGSESQADGKLVESAAAGAAAAALIDVDKIQSSSIQFDFDKAEIKPESEPVLQEIGEMLAEQPDVVVEIEGYTDQTGPAEYNQVLSERRATSVRNFLLARFNDLKSVTFKILGFGESKPVASNDTREGRALNRRVEFRVVTPEEIKRIERNND